MLRDSGVPMTASLTELGPTATRSAASATQALLRAIQH
jgi:hypothetical protein